MSPLTPHRQSTPMANPAVTPDIHQPLDVHRDFGPEGTLHFHRTLDDLAETGDFGVREVSHPGIGADAGLREEASRRPVDTWGAYADGVWDALVQGGPA